MKDFNKILQKALLSIFALQMLVVPIVNAGHHQEKGTNYSNEGAQLYATHRHGTDGDILLDPYFIPFLNETQGLTLIDVGCGAGPWAIHAAKKGAKVTCIDYQSNMIELAKQHAAKENINTIDYAVGDAASLPYLDNTYDRGISINVGCNLPSSTDMTSGLTAHFEELYRVLKEKGRLIVTAPASFGTVFSINQKNEVSLKQINNVLNDIPSYPRNDDITKHLNRLDTILRATFRLESDRIRLVKNEGELNPGDVIWRKIPGLTVPNYYHPESEYLEAAKRSGFKLVAVDKPTFKNDEDWLSYQSKHGNNVGLSKLYISHNPFVIFDFEKV